MHSREHRHVQVGVVIDAHLGLAVVQAMEAARVLGQGAAPGDGEGEEEGVEARVVEAFTGEAAGGDEAIAEKFEAMVKLRELNSRMKDFYDIWLLSRQFDFDGNALAQAIRGTLGQRGTVLPDVIAAFTDDFAEQKRTQWAAFSRRLTQNEVPSDFSQVMVAVRDFLLPVATALRFGTSTAIRWSAPGPWE